jgi:hypothetical protein
LCDRARAIAQVNVDMEELAVLTEVDSEWVSIFEAECSDFVSFFVTEFCVVLFNFAFHVPASYLRSVRSRDLVDGEFEVASGNCELLRAFVQANLRGAAIFDAVLVCVDLKHLFGLTFIDFPNSGHVLRNDTEELVARAEVNPFDLFLVAVWLDLELFLELQVLSIFLNAFLKLYSSIQQQLRFGINAFAAILLSCNFFDVVIEELLTLESVTRRAVQHGLEQLTLIFVLENVIREICAQLPSWDLAVRKLLHAEVEAGVEVLVGGVDGAGPKGLGLLALAVEVGDAGSLVQVVGTLANEGLFHAVVLVEVLLVVLD